MFSELLVSKSRTLALGGAMATLGLVTATAGAAPLTYGQAVEADSPFAYYRFNETSGTTLADQTAGGHDGTYQNSPTLGVTGAGLASDNAASFNGTDQYADIGTDAGDPDFNTFGSGIGSASYEFVLRTQTTASSSIMGIYNDDSPDDGTAVVFSLNKGTSGNTTGSTRIYVRDQQDQTMLASIDADIYDGAYHHLVATTDTAAEAPEDRLTVYVDGTEVTVTFGLNQDNNDDFNPFEFSTALGARNVRGTVGEYADLTLDEAAFYTDGLTAAQVQTHAAALVAVPEPASLALLGAGGMLLAGRRRRA